jgi:glucosamine--fructose-6-phosphate aminotransferase (isomerizing)
VHNGIIENYQMLTEVLTKRGYVFKSETDTEVIAHLIHYVHTQDPAMAFAVAVKTALNQLVGTFAVAVINAHEPDTLIGARQGSPMVLGVGEGEYFLASDVAAMVEWTKQVVYLDEGEFFLVAYD